MAERRPPQVVCQAPSTPKMQGVPRWVSRARRRQARYLVVPRACHLDRYPLAVLSALSYLGGEATLESIALYWGVTEPTAMRWARRAEERGWVVAETLAETGRNSLGFLPAGLGAWKAARKERVPAELRGHLTLVRMGLWGRLKRRRAFGTRLLAQDIRCARTTVQRALAGPCFGVIKGLFERFKTPVRWSLLPQNQNAAPPQPFFQKERSKPPAERPNPPPKGGSVSLAGALDSMAACFGLSRSSGSVT